MLTLWGKVGARYTPLSWDLQGGCHFAFFGALFIDEKVN
jgi:hypothetical protein